VDNHIVASGKEVKAERPRSGEQLGNSLGQAMRVTAHGRENGSFPRLDAGQTTATSSGAVAGLVCSLLGWAATLVVAVMALSGCFDPLFCAGMPAGIGYVFIGLLVAVVLWLSGVAQGFVALVRLRHKGGHGLAWAAILLGGLPFVVAFLFFLVRSAW
jgi:hypothetical protein